MSRAFYNLPEPEELGLKWKIFRKARQKLERVEQRRREAEEAAARIEQRIREEHDADVRRLAGVILAGEDDPADTPEALDDLTGELREQCRLGEALAQALPEAEEQLRLVIFENQATWIGEVDAVLEKACTEEREAYERARQIAETARRKRLYAESLALWVRAPTPSFNTPSDVLVRTTIEQQWGADLGRCERQHEERQRNEQLVLQQQQEGGAA